MGWALLETGFWVSFHEDDMLPIVLRSVIFFGLHVKHYTMKIKEKLPLRGLYKKKVRRKKSLIPILKGKIWMIYFIRRLGFQRTVA
jgi:hypothetical protein